MSVAEDSMTKYAVCTLLLLSRFCVYAVQVQETTRDFIKADIAGKKVLIEHAGISGEKPLDLYRLSLEFVCSNYALLSSDEDFITLACETVKKIPAFSDTETFALLEKLFAVNENRRLQKLILQNFGDSAANVSAVRPGDFKVPDSLIRQVNAYTEKILRSYGVSADDGSLLEAAVKTLGQFNDISSFPVLFTCYAFPDTELSQKAAHALNGFSGMYDKAVRAIIADGSTREKMLALDLILHNPKNSDFFKAETAENALSQTLYNREGAEFCTGDCVALKVKAVRELNRVSWTRSPVLIRKTFIAACKEYEAEVLTEEHFIEIIHAFSRLASSEAGLYLSRYLKELNRNREERKAVSTPVLLELIDALDALGDKTAFDDLLYATYQDYPEEVITAAAEALGKLKW